MRILMPEGSVLLTAFLLIAVTACGSVNRAYEDAGAPNDAQADTPPATPPDASPGAPPDAPPPISSREFISGAGHLKGQTFTLDVEIGHPIDQRSATGATYKIEGDFAAKPENQ
jgi:hypothetical protein